MIHLIYPHKNKISAPNIIGYKLIKFLSQYDEVKAHDWDSYYQILPSRGDILIGHLCPLPFTVMKRSLKNDGWKRKIIIGPYNESEDLAPFTDEFIDLCDILLTITGPYWFHRIPNHPFFKRYYPKMVRLDLAVDSTLFPQIKNKFNKAGFRKFVYIGVDNKYKNLDYLEEIFEELPGFEIHSIGRVKSSRKFIHHGFLDFSQDESKNLITNFDFMITTGINDANPTTILEAMSWGLIPICTPTSGYEQCAGILNIPTGDSKAAASILRYYQYCSIGELENIRITGRNSLSDTYTWDNFCQKVYSNIYSNNCPTIEPRKEKLVKTYNSLWIFFIKSIILNFKRGLLKLFKNII